MTIGWLDPGPLGPAAAGGRPSDRRVPRPRRRAAGAADVDPGPVPHPRRDRPGLRPGQGPGAGGREAGRRRLRRQAGDADRGHRRAGGAAHRTAGPARADPRGGVHRGDHPAPDGGHGDAGRDPRRDADRAGARRHGRHRRVRQPRAGRAVPRGRGGGHRLPLPEQAGRRPRGLHQHGPGRGVPRLRALPDRVRGRVRDRRAGPLARHRPGRAAPPQPHPRGRRPGERQRRGAGRVHRQHRRLRLPRPGRRRPWPAAGAWPRRTGGRPGPGSRWRCSTPSRPAATPAGPGWRSDQAAGTPRSSGRPSSGTGRPPCTGRSSPTCSAANPATSSSSPPTPTAAGTTPAPTGRPGSRWRARRRCGRPGPWPTRSRPARPAATADDGKLLEAEGYCDGRSRSVSFTVQGFRVAVCAEHRGDPGAAVGPGGRRGHGAQPGPAARSGRGRGRPGARGGAVRGGAARLRAAG